MQPRHLETSDGCHTGVIWNPGASGPGILALHGFTGAGLDWGPLAEHFSCPVLAPDLLGHGGSPAPAHEDAYRIEAVVEQCRLWCELSQDWMVMGYSMGGRVALRLALVLRDRLKGLILVGSTPGMEDPAARHQRMAKDRALADRIEAEGMDWFCAHWAQQPIIQSQQQIPAPIRAAMQGRRRDNRPMGIAGSLRGMGQGRVEPVWHAVHQIACPTLLITGEQDAKYTAIAGRLAAQMPNAQHVCISQAGHCTHLEATASVAAAIGAWTSLIRVTG